MEMEGFNELQHTAVALPGVAIDMTPSSDLLL